MKKEFQDVLMKAAIAAPSADNSQPWRFALRDNTLEIWIDEKRSGGPSDKSFLLSDMSVGTVIENVCQAAATLGFRTKVDFFPLGENQQPYYAAAVTFESADVSIDPDKISLENIFNRQTDRSFPWKPSLNSSEKEQLSDAASQLPGCRLKWIGSEQKKAALKVLWKAETLRFSNPSLHQELFSSIRFDVDWHTPVNEGLAPAALNVEPPARPIFKAAKSWNLMKLLNFLGAASGFGLRSAVLPNLLTPDLAVICIADTNRRSVIDGGRSLQSVWLKATELGLSVQPFAAPAVFNLAQQLPAGLAQVATIRDNLAKLVDSQNALIFLRIGHSQSKTVVKTTGRRPVESFMSNE